MIVRVAVFGPATVGLNVKVCEQVPLIAIFLQVPVVVKAAAFVPDTTMLLTVMLAEPTFLMVTVWDALAVLINWSLKETLAGVTEIMGAAEPPVPERLTTVGEPGAFDTILRLAALVPVVVGLKVTETVQDALGATVVQPFVGVKEEASVPVTVTPVTDRLAVPKFVTVTTEATLCVLIGWLTKVRLVGETDIAEPSTVKVCGTSVAAL